MNKDNHGDNKVAMVSEIDMSSCIRLREEYGQHGRLKPSYTAFVTKAVSLALRDHPYANRIPLEWPMFKRIVQLESVDMTVAAERDQPGMEQGVFAATIRNTDALDLVTLTKELQAISDGTGAAAERWQLLKRIIASLPVPLARIVLRVPLFFPSLWIKHRGGAVMISSPAKYGVDQVVAAWPWPLGFSFGLVKQRPVVVDGRVEPRPTVALVMSFDRRLMGGAPAARFFRTVCDYIERADRDMAEGGSDAVNRVGGATPIQVGD
jgi:pyruvate/2-oxoglutarate dehydrogenase complex dihydrolipoamide acyltransferase (E2) component